MIGRLTFHHLVSLGCNFLAVVCEFQWLRFSTGRGGTENIKTKFNPYPQFSLSLSHTHTHARTHIQTHLFTYRSNTSHRAIILLAIKKNEAHLSRASHFLCRHRRSSHASYR
ncbi:hypothetical protein E4U12_007131 [Claviceps purpurea]|nr:hypothetical protein E4U12_007131 [Claviceps purpurea]